MHVASVEIRIGSLPVSFFFPVPIWELFPVLDQTLQRLSFFCPLLILATAMNSSINEVGLCVSRDICMTPHTFLARQAKQASYSCIFKSVNRSLTLWLKRRKLDESTERPQFIKDHDLSSHEDHFLFWDYLEIGKFPYSRNFDQVLVCLNAVVISVFG